MEDIKEPLKADSQKESESSVKKEVIGWIEAIVSAVIVVALLITFVGRPILVDGHSMENTLQNNDRIVTTPLYKDLHHNDIVVIRRKGNLPLVKRVIALPGETINIDYANNQVIIDGKVISQPFIKEKMQVPAFQTLQFPLKVPDGFVFVMGDNRNHSDDSRDPEIGLIDKRNVFGKAIFRMWPFNKFGKIDPENYTY